MPTKVSLHKNATPVPHEAAGLDSSTQSSPVLTPTSTRVNQNAPISPVLTLESTPTATARVEKVATSPPEVEASPTHLPTAANLVRATITLPSPTPEPTPLVNDSPAVQLVNLINQERTSRGLTALTRDSRLMAAAQAHSQDMARHNLFDHIGSDGSNPGDRITRQGYQWLFFAENLACEYFTAEEVVQAWLDSPGHRTNMLAPEPEHIGVGIGDEQGADCTPYWTAVFAAGG